MTKANNRLLIFLEFGVLGVLDFLTSGKPGGRGEPVGEIVSRVTTRAQCCGPGELTWSNNRDADIHNQLSGLCSYLERGANIAQSFLHHHAVILSEGHAR